jgi:hypothetical protein
MLLPRIQEMVGSNLDHKPDFPDWGSSWFSSIPPGKFLGQYLDYTSNLFFSHSLQFIVILSTDSFVKWTMAEGTASVCRLEQVALLAVWLAYFLTMDMQTVRSLTSVSFYKTTRRHTVSPRPATYVNIHWTYSAICQTYDFVRDSAVTQRPLSSRSSRNVRGAGQNVTSVVHEVCKCAGSSNNKFV